MIIVGDALAVLKKLPDKLVQTCITSPPYYCLRDYGIDGQIGLEETPAEYIDNLVDVFREVKRVLKDNATLWINIGDSFCGSSSGSVGNNSVINGRKTIEAGTARPDKKPYGCLKPKDLMMIPHRLAIVLQEDGWYVRQDIVWQKPNCQPQSCKDRFTTSKEYIFLLAKNPKYLFNQQKEPCSPSNVEDFKRRKTLDNKGDGKARPDLARGRDAYMPKDFMRNKRDVWSVNTKPLKSCHVAPFPTELIRPCILAGSNPGDVILDCFVGSGTTGVVAYQEGRKFVGIDLNPDYANLAQQRILAEVGIEEKIKTFGG